MNIEKGKISDFQLMLLVFCFIQGVLVVPSSVSSITQHDTWIVIILAFLISLPFVLVYVALAQSFPGKSLIQINDIIFGSLLGKFVSLLYICFFLLLLSLNLRDLADFYINFIMPETPLLFFLIVFILVCGFAVYHGIECLARLSFTLIVLWAGILAFTIMLLWQNFKFSNFLPVLEIPITAFVHGTHIFVTYPFGEIFIILMLFPSLNNFQHIRKVTLIGFTSSALFLLFIAIRNAAALGIVSTITTSPSYQVSRLIDIGNFLSRVEILTSIALTTTLFMKVSILYYATVLSISQITRLRSYWPLIFPIGSIAVCLALILFDSTIDHGIHATNYHPFLAAPFEFILPPLTLLIAKALGFPKSEGG